MNLYIIHIAKILPYIQIRYFFHCLFALTPVKKVIVALWWTHLMQWNCRMSLWIILLKENKYIFVLYFFYLFCFQFLLLVFYLPLSLSLSLKQEQNENENANSHIRWNGESFHRCLVHTSKWNSLAIFSSISIARCWFSHTLFISVAYFMY